MPTKTIGKLLIIVVLFAAFALFTVQQKGKQSVSMPVVPMIDLSSPAQKIPRLVDLGAKSCVPCKMMVPVLKELRNEYKGKLQVEFIDVWENPSAGNQYKIRVIPTQIFFDLSGKELFRHVGFMSKEDILAKWKGLGFSLGKENGE